MLQCLSLLVYFCLVPMLLGGVYTLLTNSEKYYIHRAWAVGYAIYLACFSAWYRISCDMGIGYKPSDVKTLSLFTMATASIIAIIVLCTKKEKGYPKWGGLKYRFAWPMLLVLILFVLSHLLLKLDYDGVRTAYITCYSFDLSIPDPDPVANFDLLSEYQANTIGIYNLLIFYLSVNEMVIVNPTIMLKVVLPIVHLVLSFVCYEFLAERFQIKENKQYLYLLLVYSLYLITVFQERYNLYGIYTNFWEPLTVYASVFLPFQFGMMLYLEEAVTKNNIRNIIVGAFLTIIAFWIGSLYPMKPIVLILAPEILGVAVGIVRRIINASHILSNAGSHS